MLIPRVGLTLMLSEFLLRVGVYLMILAVTTILKGVRGVVAVLIPRVELNLMHWKPLLLEVGACHLL